MIFPVHRLFVPFCQLVQNITIAQYTVKRTQGSLIKAIKIVVKSYVAGQFVTIRQIIIMNANLQVNRTHPQNMLIHPFYSTN